MTRACSDMRPQQESPNQEVPAGLIERITYHNAENGFCVLRARVRGHRDVVTVVGHAATIAAGTSGEWVNDRTHGQQFKARFLSEKLTLVPVLKPLTSSGACLSEGGARASQPRSEEGD
jgi:hypothetical protein